MLTDWTCKWEWCFLQHKFQCSAAQNIDTLRGIKEASGNISVSHSEMLRAGFEWNIGWGKCSHDENKHVDSTSTDILRERSKDRQEVAEILTGKNCKLCVQHCISSLSLSLSLWTWLNHQASGHGTIEQAAKHGIKPRHQKLRGKHRGASAGPGAQDCTVSIWLGKRHKLLQWDNTNLDGQVLGEEPPSHPSLQEGCALTEELSAVALPWEEQQLELEMTNRKDYGLYRVAVSRINKVDCRLWWIDHRDTYSTVRNQICVTLIYNTDRWLTLCDVDSKRALGDLLACEEHMNLVRALQNRTIGATENTVPFVFQDELHRVLFALRIDDDHTDIAITSTYVCQKTIDYWRTVVFYMISVSSGCFFHAYQLCRCQSMWVCLPHCLWAPDLVPWPGLCSGPLKLLPHSLCTGSCQCPGLQTTLSPNVEGKKTNWIQSPFYPVVTVFIVKTHNKYCQWALTLWTPSTLGT